MQNTAELEERFESAIRNLYDVFGDYRGRDHWDDPLDDISDEQRRAPAIHPVSELSDAQIGYFSHGLYCSRDAQWEYENRLAMIKYFLPRLLEVLCRSGGLGLSGADGIVFDDWWIAETMNLTKWQEWPRKERDAVERLLLTWCEWSFKRTLGPGMAFLFLMNVGIPLGTLLVHAKNGSTAAIMQLMKFLLSAEAMNAMVFHYRLWPEEEVDHRQQIPFIQWMMNPGLTGRIEAHFFEAEGNAFYQGLVSEVVQCLEHVQNRWRQADDAPKWMRVLLEEQ